VPPATSRKAAPGWGAREEMKLSFHNLGRREGWAVDWAECVVRVRWRAGHLCKPPDMRSFITSYLSATL